MSKVLLILGASSDIGQFLIEEVADSFDTIIAHYFSNDKSLITLKESLSEKLQMVKSDFNSEEETKQFIKYIENNLPCPTHIVHLPAKRTKYQNFHKSNWYDVEMDINISLRSVYMVLCSFIRKMVKLKKGKIVFMLTSCTINTPKYMANYSVVKFALLGLMKSLAVEYADKGINVNAVSPSMVETKFLENVPHFVIEQNAENNPLKRNAEVGDVIPTIIFLLSEKADYITGQNIVVSGGSVI